MTEENLEQRLERKREELRLSSINIQTTKIDSWNDDSYFKKHLSNVETEIVLPKVSKNINFNIHIADTGRLIFSPGSEFHFLKKNHLQCFGQLVANGEKDNEIIFTTQDNINALQFSFSQYDSTLKHAIVKGSLTNTTELKEGAGIIVLDSGINIENCQIYNHNGRFQGGISISNSRFNISNTNIHHNNALYNGGGLLIDDSKGNFNDNKIYENSAASGGGLMIERSVINMNRNHINNNYAIKERVINNNYAIEETFKILFKGHVFKGGGMAINESKVFGDGNIIEFNEADYMGGVVMIDSYESRVDSVFLGKSNIVRFNTAKEYGGIYKGKKTKINCEVYKNSPE